MGLAQPSRRKKRMAHRAKHRRNALILRWLRVEKNQPANGNPVREPCEREPVELDVVEFLRGEPQ